MSGSSEFISLDFHEFSRKAEDLFKMYRLLEEKLKKEIAKRVLSEAGKIFLQEQRRLLLKTYPNSEIAGLLTVWTKVVRGGYRLYVGVPDTVTKEQAILSKVIEFGRPGVRSVKKGGKDSKGRKIGKVESHSYVRASKFLKGEEVKKKIQQLLDEELEKAWKPENFGF